MDDIFFPRRSHKFVRDFDIHGHHRDCDCSLEAMDRDETHLCTCRQLDEDDWYAAGDRCYDAWKDAQLERTGEDYD